jgi:hypothetical protein
MITEKAKNKQGRKLIEISKHMLLTTYPLELLS